MADKRLPFLLDIFGVIVVDGGRKMFRIYMVEFSLT